MAPGRRRGARTSRRTRPPEPARGRASTTPAPAPRPRHLALAVLANRGELVLAESVLGAEPLLVALDRVTPLPFLVHPVGYVAHVVVGAVPVHAHGVALDQSRSGASRARSAAARAAPNTASTSFPSTLAREPVARRPLHRIDRVLEIGGRRVGELVVLQHEHHREAVDAGEVERLMALAVRRRPLAEEGHRDARLPPHLHGQGEADGHLRHVGQHRDHPDASEGAIAEVHVAVLASGHPVGPAHVVGQVAIWGDPRTKWAPRSRCRMHIRSRGPRTNEAPTEIASCPRPS